MVSVKPVCQGDELDALEPVRTVADEDITHIFDVLEGGIKGEADFLFSGFTVLDIYMTMLAGWHPDKNVLYIGETKGSLRSVSQSKIAQFTKRQSQIMHSDEFIRLPLLRDTDIERG